MQNKIKWNRKYKLGYGFYELTIEDDVYTIDDNYDRVWKLKKNTILICNVKGYKHGKELVRGILYI